MYHQEVPKRQQLTLSLAVHVESNGPLILKGEITEELEPKVMVAMRNSREKKCLENGILTILLPCLAQSSSDVKHQKILAFCRWLSIRSDVRVSHYYA